MSNEERSDSSSDGEEKRGRTDSSNKGNEQQRKKESNKRCTRTHFPPRYRSSENSPVNLAFDSL
jgi:hypothetical protein